MKTRYFNRSILVAVVALQSYCAIGQIPSSADDEAFDCPVTIGVDPRSNYENDALRTALWPKGKVVFKPDGPGRIYKDGALGIKWGWIRLKKGQLTIVGRRLDAESPPLRSVISDGYGVTGLQPTGLIFAAPGCWEVTGILGDSRLTFVTLVVLIDD